MSTFKLKAKKNKCLPSFKTVNGTHQQFTETFEKKQLSLPEKKDNLDDMTRKLDIINKKPRHKYTTKDICMKSSLKTSIDSLRIEIADIENNVDELEYYSMTGNLLMDYYDIIEKYDNDDNSIKTIEHIPQNSKEKKELDRLELLTLEKSKKKKTKQKTKRYYKKRKRYTTNIMNFLGVADNSEDEKNESNKATILDDFLGIIDGNYVSEKRDKYNPIKLCTFCSNEKTLIQAEGIYVCTKCGETEAVIIESERPSYKDPMPEKSGYPYKRMNHFNECISQFQAKESTEIPNEVYNQIYSELKKNRITNYSKLTLECMKKILKKLRLHKYYEHIYHIISKINKLPPPTISREMEERLRQKFREMQGPFEEHRPKNRSNFLSYSYVLHKLCQLLELDNVIKCFPLLKNRSKLRQQDNIWKKICKDCKWKYYPSI